eukprot:2211034-Pleurochrysis_carterae.AAC.4
MSSEAWRSNLCGKMRAVRSSVRSVSSEAVDLRQKPIRSVRKHAISLEYEQGSHEVCDSDAAARFRARQISKRTSTSALSTQTYLWHASQSPHQSLTRP